MGRINFNVFLGVFLPILLLLPCYTYYMATIKEKVVPPFPQSTVTNTACPYPQNILFRFGMLTASSFFILIYFAVYHWLNYEIRRTQFPETIPSW